MKLEFVQDFLMLYQTGNFLEAAERLFISQSTLSRHIQMLESEMGVELFERSTRKVELSADGKLFLPYARKMAEYQRGYLDAFAEKIDHMKTEIRIGVCPSATQYSIYDALSGFMKENANVKIRIIEEDTPKLRQMVLDGECRIAVVWDDQRHSSRVAEIPCYTDSVVLACSREHKLAERKRVSLEELKYEKFSVLTSDEALSQLCLRAFEEVGFLPQQSRMTSRERHVLESVGRGTLVALLWKRTVEYFHLDNVVALDLIPELMCSVNIIYDKKVPLSAPEKLLIQTLTNKYA